jgi:uncharacterized protein
MNEQEIISRTIAYVKDELKHAEGGHDWWHIERVWNNTKLIAQTEPVNMLVAELGALLHDIADSKFNNGDEEIGPAKAKMFLTGIGADDSTVDHVVNIIRHISFKGGNFTAAFTSPELAVVQDADRLDALGAIGIARAFNYGGFKNRALYDPTVKPNMQMGKEEYKAGMNPTINHFYEKLLLLKDRMNTPTGKVLAEQRHVYMEAFLEQFYSEWEGRG